MPDTTKTMTDDEVVAWLLARVPGLKLTASDRQLWIDYVAACGGVERTGFRAQATATLEEQAAATERAAVNQRGHCDNLCRLAAHNKRSFVELLQEVQWTPALEVAAATLRQLADRQRNDRDQSGEATPQEARA